MLDFAKALNKSWIRNIAVTSTSNKDMTSYRKEVKKQAIRMAKEKATYLLEAIDEKIGSVISVEEIISENQVKDFGRGYPYYNYWGYNYGNLGGNNSISNSSMNSNSVMTNNSSANNDEEKIGGLSKIKLRYEVKTIFEIN